MKTTSESLFPSDYGTAYRLLHQGMQEHDASINLIIGHTLILIFCVQKCSNRNSILINHTLLHFFLEASSYILLKKIILHINMSLYFDNHTL